MRITNINGLCKRIACPGSAFNPADAVVFPSNRASSLTHDPMLPTGRNSDPDLGIVVRDS